MIKILFEHSIFLHQKNGGISNYIIKINEKLKNYNVDTKIISLISINNFLNHSKVKKNVIFRLKIIPKFCRKFFFLLNDLFFLIYSKLSKPDLVHFSYYNNNLIKFLKAPYVLTVYDLINERFDIQNNQFNKKNLIMNAKHIICISNFTKSELIDIYEIPPKKISVVHLGVDEKKNEIINNKENFILFVGDRGRYKNFEKLIECFGNSKYLKKNFNIVCFGDNEFSKKEKNKLDTLNIRKNFLHVKGDNQKLEKYYKKATLFVSVSLMEGFGLTPLEAMSLNCPVICSDIPVFREVLGNSCEYVDPLDVNNIRIKIETILKSKNEQERLIELGKKKVTEYPWEKCTAETSKIYEKILNGK